MAKKVGLLTQISEGVADDKVSVSSLLQKCILLGGQAGSEKLRDWARQELNGYEGFEGVPEYRHIHTPLVAHITNSWGVHGHTQRIRENYLPKATREKLTAAGYRVDELVLNWPISEIEAMSQDPSGPHTLTPNWADSVAADMTRAMADPNTIVESLYWSVPGSVVKGVLGRIRMALAEHVAELDAQNLQSQVPDRAAAEPAIKLRQTGGRLTVNQVVQQAGDGGTNVAGGRDVTVAAPAHEAEGGFWARLRKRGMVVAVSTIVAGITGLAGLFQWLGWMPFQNDSHPGSVSPPSTSATAPMVAHGSSATPTLKR